MITLPLFLLFSILLLYLIIVFVLVNGRLFKMNKREKAI